ncbi:MAG: prepilin-type N-terminal cleavage/methylation domain-containing protein [Deltaproteobacteria bacterium]|nr:prepilin-type N-terminal cleavage/methylation domain-containing protein [Candidatus Anaeroferrophillus wilburensis]MBN2888366.1 prepilin-type N-terminal cleavage/methylation domain-containing protein [Deltaproteobacteria bacterium]
MKKGFTLIEVVLSLTIMAMVIMVLYQAFAVATRVWSRQQVKGEGVAREQMVNRLFRDDFGQLVPYTVNWSKGQGFFFAGGPRTVLYVTTNGFAAQQRQEEELYFCCCYLESEQDGSLSLHLYKSPYPETLLLETLDELNQRSPEQRAGFRPPRELREQSLLLVDGLQQAAFSYDKEQLVSDFAAQGAGDELLPADFSLADRSWSEARPPGLLLFSYQLSAKQRHLLIKPAELPPVKTSHRSP